VTGGLWGTAAAAVVLGVDSIVYQVFMAFVIGGMGAGAVAGSAAHLPALLAFLVLSSTPLALSLLVMAEPVYLAMGTMILLFIGLLTVIARSFNASLLRTLRLQVDNADLIENLAQGRDALELRVAERTAELRAEIAEHDTTTANLRKSEEELRLITDNVPVLISYVDKDLRYTFVNGVHEKWFDRPLSDFLGKHPKEVLDGPVYEQMQPHIEKALKGESESFEVTARVRDEALHQFRVNLISHVGGDGTVKGFFALVRNITRYKRAEQALRESEERYRRLVELSPTGIFINHEGLIKFANPTAVSLLGAASSDDLIGLPVTDIIGPDFRDAVQQRVERVVTSAVALPPMEQVYVGVDGRVFDVEATATPIMHEGQNAVLCVFHDISERKHAESALKSSEERLTQAAQLAKLGHWVWDGIEDRCIYCSEEHARIHGITVAEYLARSATLDGDFSFTHPDDREKYKAAFKALRNGRNLELEYRIITPDGETRHIQEVAKPVFDDTGRVVQEYGTVQDITDRKQAEEQLRQAQKMEAVGQLTGGIAHDFNNLLAIILGNLELMQEGLGHRTDLPQLIDGAVRAGERGAELTYRLLAFSRRQALAPAVTDLNALATGMIGLLEPTMGGAIEIETALDERLWPALLDPSQTETALLNLALNSRHAMPEGGKLTIATANLKLNKKSASRHQIEPGRYVMLSVTDNGAGIAPDLLDQVFEPFFTTKDVGQGSGLGLSMVYGFVRQSGGFMDIDSKVDEGTTARLYFPKAETEMSRPLDKQAQLEAPAATEAGETVLLVEDEAGVRDIAFKMMSGLGYRVLAAEDGKAALAVLDETPGIDLLFTDLVLPHGMNGVTLAQQAVARHPGLKVLYTTGHAESGILQDSALGRDVKIVRKPYRMAVLAQQIRQTLDDTAG
jgi:PAS domain S-box-containing protein